MSVTTFSSTNNGLSASNGKVHLARHGDKPITEYIFKDRRAYESENHEFPRRTFGKLCSGRRGHNAPGTDNDNEMELKTTAELKYRYVAERDAPSPPPA